MSRQHSSPAAASANAAANAVASERAIKHVLLADVSVVATHPKASAEKRRDAQRLLDAWHAMRAAKHPAHFRGALVALERACATLRTRYGVEVTDLHIERYSLRQWRLPRLGGVVVRSVVYDTGDGLLVLNQEAANALALERELAQAEAKRLEEAAQAAKPKRATRRTKKAAQATA
jgi:hypothetical protein